MQNIGSNIRKLRIEHGYTQLQLAEVLGYARTSVSRMELEEIEPPLWALIGIADLFGISLDELVGHEVKPKLEPVLFNMKDIAERAGVSEHVVRRYTKLGIIPSVRRNKTYYYTLDAVEQIIAYRKQVKTYEKNR